jgi:hypothetical protein
VKFLENILKKYIDDEFVKVKAENKNLRNKLKEISRANNRIVTIELTDELMKEYAKRFSNDVHKFLIKSRINDVYDEDEFKKFEKSHNEFWGWVDKKYNLLGNEIDVFNLYTMGDSYYISNESNVKQRVNQVIYQGDN